MTKGKTWRVNGRDYEFKKELLVGDYLDLSDLILDIVEEGNKFSAESVVRFAKNAQNMKDLAILALSPVDKDQDEELIKTDILKFKVEWVAEIVENFYSASEALDGAFLLSLEKRLELKKAPIKTRSRNSKPSNKTSTEI